MGTKFATAIIKGKDSQRLGREAATKAMHKAGVRSVDFSLVFASSAYDYKAVIKGVREATDNAPLVGCSTAGEFTEEKVEKGSVACAVISTDTHKFFIGMGKGLKDDEQKALKEASSGFPASVEGYPYFSALLLLDGLAGKGEESVLSAVETLGANVKFSGGAAGTVILLVPA